MIFLSITAFAAGFLCPQGVESSGPMAGMPHTISVAKGTSAGTIPMSNAEIWFKDPGFVTTPPSSGVQAGRPDFRIASMLRGLKSIPDVASMSIGLDWILADSQGRVDLPSGGWGMLSVSVAPFTAGVTGSLLKSQSAGDGVGGDIYTYIVPGSSGPPGWVDVLQRGQNSNEINIGGTPNIDGHDVFIAGYRLAAPIVALLPASPTFYFTIPKAELGKIPVSTGWWGPTSGSPVPSGATILMTTWTPLPTGGSWSTPSVFLKYSDLTLGKDEEIDALAVDPFSKRLLLSTRTLTRETILVAIPTTTGIKLKDYVLKDGKTPVSKRMGMLKTDDIDAICALDPGRGRGAQFLQFTMGRPQRNSLVPSWPNHGSVSVFRVQGPADEMQTWLNGWPRNGNPQPSIGILALTFPSLPNGPLIIAPGVPKPSLPLRFNGGPIQFNKRLQIPRIFSRQGLPIQFNWLMFESGATGNYALPHPSVIFL